jgi:hypothetical protein
MYTKVYIDPLSFFSDHVLSNVFNHKSTFLRRCLLSQLTMTFTKQVEISNYFFSHRMMTIVMFLEHTCRRIQLHIHAHAQRKNEEKMRKRKRYYLLHKSKKNKKNNVWNLFTKEQII